MLMAVSVTVGSHRTVRSARLQRLNDWAAEEVRLIERTWALNARFGVAGIVD